MTAIITAHAAQRYVDRIDATLTLEQARQAIRSHTVAILAAHAFGNASVLTAAGARLVIESAECGSAAVVTVKHAHNWRRSLPGRMVRSFRSRKLARERDQ